MIEFKGYISGKAEKYFFNRSRKIGLIVIVCSNFLILFPVALFFLQNGNRSVFIFCCTMFAILPLLVFIPKSKKEKLSLIPKRIYTDKESITCVTEKCLESKYIGDEKVVKDHGEFYEIVYPVGKVSDKFICQKSLLTQGTLEEFEALFKGKIVRKTDK